MFRLTLLIVALTFIPEPSPATTLADKLDKLYEKLEKLTVPPPSQPFVELSERTAGHYAKLEETNSLGPLEDLPEEGLTEEEEAMLSGIEAWGGMSARQIVRLMKEIQEIRHRKTGEALDKNSMQSAKLGEGPDEEASEDDDEMQDITSLDYAMDAEDGDENWDAEDLPMSTTNAAKRGQQASSERTPVIDPVAATAERPRILDDSLLSPGERMEVRRSALANVERAVHTDKCLLPQPRWLCIRQMAPAADTIYMPPCVVLHRCTVDSGCCYNEAETCGPIAGEYVAIPLYLSKADGNLIAARMLFYNHTRCSCISRDSEGQRDAARIRTESPRLIGDMQPSTSAVPVSSMSPSSYAPLMGVAELHTAPPELRRCTCPTLFMPRTLADGGCACTCRWAELGRRRECLSLARGREHFGIRDRRCVIRGQCSPPDCQYGPYDRAGGRCPPRPHRHVRSRYQKTITT